MKRFVSTLILVYCSAIYLQAENNPRQHGTIVRMRMSDCLEPQRGFMSAMAGAPRQQDVGQCPEYVLVSDKVVYVIVGKTSGMLIPLAEVTQFRIQKNELLVRVDDENRETKFQLREMVLRSEWDRMHANILNEDDAEPARHKLMPAIVEQSSRTSRATLPQSQ